MQYDKIRSLLGCGLLLVLSFSASSLYAGTCDQAVQFKGGLLSIQSNGCSLQQLLQAVQTQAGIEVDIPLSAAGVPVVLNADPAEPATVITSLLSTTKYNYYLVGGAQNSVARVVISEIKPPAPSALPVQVTPPQQVASVAPPKAVPPVAKKETKKKKQDQDKDDKLAEVINSDDEPKPKPELDESTLRNLPQLPPGIPAALWRLYPEIVQNGGVVPNNPLSLSNGNPIPQPAAGQDPNVSYYPQDAPPVPKGVVGLPTLPPGIDPNMGKIYPWNLMQTINGPITYPNIVLPPMAPPIGGTPSHP